MTAVQKRRLGIQLVAFLGGLGLLGVLIRNVGVAEVASHLRQIGWLAPLLPLPYIAVLWCDTQGWACAIPPTAQAHVVPLWYLSLARLAGEAINDLTPTASIGGEPVKVYLLRARGLTTDAGLASVVVAKTTLTISQVVFILLGLPFFFSRLGWVRQGWWVLGSLLVLAAGFVTLLIRWQRRKPMGMAVRALGHLLPQWRGLEGWAARAQLIDAHLLGFYDGNYRRFIASTIYHFLGWLLGAAEVFFFCRLMGVSATPVDALIIEAMVQPVTAAALVIPGALGVREAGGVFLCRLVGLDDGVGLTLMALKRARETAYNLIGLAVLARVGGALLPRKVHSL